MKLRPSLSVSALCLARAFLSSTSRVSAKPRDEPASAKHLREQLKQRSDQSFRNTHENPSLKAQRGGATEMVERT